MRDEARLVILVVSMIMLSAMPALSQPAHPTRPASPARIVLPEHAKIHGPRVLLGEIARIDASDPELSLRLDRVLVGLAPLPGQSRWLERGEIEQALALEGFAPGEIEFDGAPGVELARTSQAIQEKLVRATVLQALSTRLNVSRDQIVLTRLDIDSQTRVGGGKVRLSLLELDNPKFNAPMSAELMVYLDEIPTTRITVNIEAAIASVSHQPARTRSRPSRTRTSGSRLVRSGQPVEIALEGPGMRISARGKARGSGGLGDEIAVENTISGNVIRCVVIGAGKVLVEWNPISGLKGVRVQ